MDSEPELLLEVSKGNAAAFERLFNLYYNVVLSQVLVYKKSYSAAEDYTQDIFLKVWNNREKLPAVKCFKNYVFILSRNMILDAIEKKAIALSNCLVPDIMEDFQTPDKQLEYTEIYKIIMNGAETLPPQQKQVFLLSRMEQKSNSEIAIELGIAQSTVRWHLIRALSSLKEYIIKNHAILFFLALSLVWL